MKILRPSPKYHSEPCKRQDALIRVAKTAPHPKNGLLRLSRDKARLVTTQVRQHLYVIAKSERLEAGSNHLKVKPFDWFLPTEPQMVYALANQLNDNQSHIQLARVNALLTALSKATLLKENRNQSLPLLQMDCIQDVAAEKLTKAGKRIDLFISGRCGDTPVEALVEFKLGHAVTPGQLQSYTQDDRGCTPENSLLVVTAPQLSAYDAAQIIRANSDRPCNSQWGFIDLRHLLYEFSCALPVAYDDEEFARVRHSLQKVTESWAR